MDETPLILDRAIEGDATRLAEAWAGPTFWREDGTLAIQLCDLIDARSPAVDLTADELDAWIQLEAPSSRPGC